MKDQILLLLELQKIDTRVLEVRASMAAIPEKLKPAKQDLAKLEALLQEEKNRLADTEKWRREQEAHIASEQDAIAKAKAKLQSAKNATEFAAASREIDNKRRALSEREDEVLKVIEALEKSRAEIDAHEKDVDQLRQHVRAEDEKIQARLAELESEAAAAGEGRDDIVAKINKPLMVRYERTLKARGVAVAPCEGGVCQGCHMAVPPQLNNILARLDSVQTCPRCHRILFRPETLGDDAPRPE